MPRYIRSIKMSLLCRGIAGWCRKHGVVSEEEYPIVLYGIQVLLNTSLKILGILLIGVMLHQLSTNWWELLRGRLCILIWRKQSNVGWALAVAEHQVRESGIYFIKVPGKIFSKANKVPGKSLSYLIYYKQNSRRVGWSCWQEKLSRVWQSGKIRLAISR